MRTTMKLTFAAVTAAAFVMVATMNSPTMAAGDEAVIKKRVTLMKKEISKPFKVVKNFVKKGEGSAADVAASARIMSAAAGKITSMYPKGTHRGAYDEKLTRALPKIWEDWAGFEAAAKTLAAETAKLAAVAATGDAAAIKAQAGAVGKKGCGGCHKPFRGDKVK